MSDMFCFQCEQAAGGKVCAGSKGVCGKLNSTSNLLDDMTGALIGLARAADGKKPLKSTYWVMLEGQFTAITNVNFNDPVVSALIDKINAEKAKLGGVGEPYTMWDLWRDNEDVRSLKSLILLGLRGMGAYAYHAWVLGYTDEVVNDFFFTAMRAIGSDMGAEELLPLEIGRATCRERG